MLDELRVRLAEQGIGYDDYLRVTERDEAKILEDFRPDAERRVKTLLVLSDIAEKEGIEVTDAELATDLARSRERYTDNPRLVAYLESARGQAYTRSLLRRSKTVETLVDRWIEQHPEFENVQHIEGDGHAHGHTHDIGIEEAVDARPDGYRDLESGRARLRHLQPAVQTGSSSWATRSKTTWPT